jgi:dihydroxy-acid dehydratase
MSNDASKPLRSQAWFGRQDKMDFLLSLAPLKDGDMITLDVAARSLHLHVGDEELVAGRKALTPPQPHAARGYQKLHVDRALQADRGVDFDFLVGRSGSPVPRDNH